MSKAFLFLFLALATSSFAKEVKLLLTCDDPFSGNIKIEFWADDKGQVLGKQFEIIGGKVHTSTFAVDSLHWKSAKEIQISNWYGYDRFLSHSKGNQWVIDYSDECSGSSSSTTCK